MTSRTRAKYEASRRIVDGIGATFDRLPPTGRRGLCRSLAAQLTGRLTLNELQAWEAKLAKAEKAAKDTRPSLLKDRIPAMLAGDDTPTPDEARWMLDLFERMTWRGAMQVINGDPDQSAASQLRSMAMVVLGIEEGPGEWQTAESEADA